MHEQIHAIQGLAWLGLLQITRAMNDHELLTAIDGVGDVRAAALLDHFGDGRKVAQSACRYWGEITKVDGFTEAQARGVFHKMKDAEVFHKLRGY